MGKLVDLTGKRLGRLVVLCRSGTDSPVRWDVMCDCGCITSVAASSLGSGNTRSCGCLKRETISSIKRKTIPVGTKYGMLTVVSECGVNKHNKLIFSVLCDCGNTSTVTGASLRGGHVKSCGCMEGFRPTRGGLSDTRVYRAWSSMFRRCYNKDNPAYPSYGGRGIVVCERWKSLDAFIEDMGEPSEYDCIDRIDNDGDYTPENCRWATYTEQNNNRRNNRIVTVLGQPMTFINACRSVGVNEDVMRHRIMSVYGNVNNWPESIEIGEFIN